MRKEFDQFIENHAAKATSNCVLVSTVMGGIFDSASGVARFISGRGGGKFDSVAWNGTVVASRVNWILSKYFAENLTEVIFYFYHPY